MLECKKELLLEHSFLGKNALFKITTYLRSNFLLLLKKIIWHCLNSARVQRCHQQSIHMNDYCNAVPGGQPGGEGRVEDGAEVVGVGPGPGLALG